MNNQKEWIESEVHKLMNGYELTFLSDDIIKIINYCETNNIKININVIQMMSGDQKYQVSIKNKIKKQCINCGRNRIIIKDGLCKICYKKEYNNRKIECKKCRKMKIEYKNGFCKKCYVAKQPYRRSLTLSED
jgi:hypothetical protein